MTNGNAATFAVAIILLALTLAYCSLGGPMRVILVAFEAFLVLIVLLSCILEPPARRILRILNIAVMSLGILGMIGSAWLLHPLLMPGSAFIFLGGFAISKFAEARKEVDLPYPPDWPRPV